MIYRIWNFQLLNSGRTLQNSCWTSARPSADFWVSAVPKIVVKPTLLVFCHCKTPQKPTTWATAFNLLDGNRMSYVNIYCIGCTKPHSSSFYSQFRWPLFHQLILNLENHFCDSCNHRRMALELSHGFSPRGEFFRSKGQCLLSISWLHKHKGRIAAKPSLDFLCKDMCYHLTSETRKQSNACFSLIHSAK